MWTCCISSCEHLYKPKQPVAACAEQQSSAVLFYTVPWYRQQTAYSKLCHGQSYLHHDYHFQCTITGLRSSIEQEANWLFFKVQTYLEHQREGMLKVLVLPSNPGWQTTQENKSNHTSNLILPKKKKKKSIWLKKYEGHLQQYHIGKSVCSSQQNHSFRAAQTWGSLGTKVSDRITQSHRSEGTLKMT